MNINEKQLTCKVCGNADFNQSYIGKEMQLGMHDEFVYFKCAKCGCLQIAEIPNNIGKYYPDNYYSFHFRNKELKIKITDFLLKNAIQSRMGQFKPIGWIARLFKEYYRNAHFYLTDKRINYNSKILDVGCGIGELLVNIHQWGFRNLTGVDPYLKKEITYFDTVKLYKKDIFTVEEKYDLIMLHHSFEHMSDPNAVVSKLNELLSDDGLLVISIPVVNGYLWRKYQMNWYQVDAPRHFFLHTVNSIAYLAKKNGLRVKEIMYDSYDGALSESEYYSRDTDESETREPITRKTRNAFRKKVKELNNLKDGDQACFMLEKANE
ncbi:putative methyltransferase [Bacteroidia bacterium]|nr:putative methyltransferase [Bacteroidia bacterium]